MPPHGTPTFLLTDIEDSTRLWQSAPEAMQAALEHHDRILRQGIEGHGGRVFKTAGDAFYATFDSPGAALAAAVGLQRALLDETWPAATPIRVRAALHAGPASPRDGDWFGPGLNVAARILSATRGGQTLLSGETAHACADATSQGAQLESRGWYRLKGIDEPVELIEACIPGGSALSPPPDSGHVCRVVPIDGLWQPRRAIRNNLPAERDAFVGRAAELADIARRFEAGERLLTILGPAGTGKTRFACRYARAWLGDWPGGVAYCDLASARSLEGILFVVANALDVPLAKDDPVSQLGRVIAARGRCLVILDNFEQIVPHAAATVGRWLAQAAEASFAATSRERLQVPGESVFAIGPLPLAGDAVELFVLRARTLRPEFALNDDNRPAVAEVVRLLDGLPLAIELAAARIRVFSPLQLVERLRDRFRLLGGARGDAARQATLKAAIDWSWDLLAPWEQAAFAQCSSFEGGFTMEAAESVLDLGAWPAAPPAMDVVQALVDKSLLRTWIPGGRPRYDVDEPYFGMYLSLHEYAAARLADCGTEAATRAARRHGVHYAAFGSLEALDALNVHGGMRRRESLLLELDNLIAACERAIARRDAPVAVATFCAAWVLLELRGPFGFCLTLAPRVLALDDVSGSLRVMALSAYARVLWRTGRIPESVPRLDEALAIAREANDRRFEGWIRSALGYVASATGHPDDAQAHYEAAVAMLREVGHRRLEASVLTNLGVLRIAQGRLTEARAICETALAIHREVGHRVAEGAVLGNLAGIRADLGEPDAAQQLRAAAIAIHRETGNRWGECVELGNLAEQLEAQGRLDESRAAFVSAIAIAGETGERRLLATHMGHLADVLARQGARDEAMAMASEALAIHRELGNRRLEGELQGRIGDMLATQGRHDEARSRYELGESLLRAVGAKDALAGLLCAMGRFDLDRGRADLARHELAEAETLVRDIGVLPGSALGRRAAELRRAISPIDR